MLFALLVIASGIVFFRSAPDAASTTPEPEDVAGRKTETSANTPTHTDAQPVDRPDGHTGTAEPDEPGCMTLQQLESDPRLLQDAIRIDSVNANGSHIEVFRDIDEAALKDFAAQQDSAAMVILGERAVLRALGLDAGRAVSTLQFEEGFEERTLLGKSFSDAARLELNDAAYWFYQAALHGRLFALRNYGEVVSAQFGGPVGLGWISQADYDALDSREKNAIIPPNLYQSLVSKIAPELLDGALGQFVEMTTTADVQNPILDKLHDEFTSDLADAGLSPISVPAAVSPPVEELYELLCTSVRNDYLRRQSLQE